MEPTERISLGFPVMSLYEAENGFSEMSRKLRGEVLGHAMPVARIGIPKEETYKKYGADSREVEIDSLECHGTLA